MDKEVNGVNNNKKVTRVRPRSGGGRVAGCKEHLYKILVIGEIGTGKTSFIKRYVHQFFSTHYRATIGVDFALKVIEWDEKTLIRLQLWDIAGQERFGNMTRVYYKEAVGAIVVFDISRPTSFEAVLKWKSDLDSKVVLTDGKPIPCILLANKCDLPADSGITDKHYLDKFCRENNFLGWFLTSAKDNVNVDEAANFLIAKILQNEHFLTKSDEFYDVLRLNSRQKRKSNCWCSS